LTNGSVIVNPEALEPLFAPWEEPTRHRVRAKREGDPAEVVLDRLTGVRCPGGAWARMYLPLVRSDAI
jgi:hypothetical protein